MVLERYLSWSEHFESCLQLTIYMKSLLYRFFFDPWFVSQLLIYCVSWSSFKWQWFLAAVYYPTDRETTAFPPKIRRTSHFEVIPNWHTWFVFFWVDTHPVDWLWDLQILTRSYWDVFEFCKLLARLSSWNDRVFWYFMKLCRFATTVLENR